MGEFAALDELAGLLGEGPPPDEAGGVAPADAAFEELAALVAPLEPPPAPAPAAARVWQQRGPALMAFARQARRTQQLESRLVEAEGALAALRRRWRTRARGATPRPHMTV